MSPNSVKLAKGKTGNSMNKTAMIVLLVALPFLMANGEQRNKTNKTTYGKYTSHKGIESHHASTADSSALTAATTHQKKMDSELKKLESQSDHLQTSRQASQKVKPLPLRASNLDRGSQKSPAINFQSKAPKNGGSSSNRSRGRSGGRSVHVKGMH
jgi:hypothetical protein